MSVHGGGVGCLPQCMLGCHPPRMENPPPGPGRPPPDQADPPRMENPPGPGRPPPGPGRPPPPREADSSIRSTSGRYASYWNAFLCLLVFLLDLDRDLGSWSNQTELMWDRGRDGYNAKVYDPFKFPHKLHYEFLT